MDRVVGEGLATVFERDAAGMPAPWGQYPPNVVDWVKELRALPSDAPWKQWMSRHPDGRRWIGFKAGTYIADQASRASGRTAAQLVNVPSAEVVVSPVTKLPRTSTQSQFGIPRTSHRYISVPRAPESTTNARHRKAARTAFTA